MSGHSLRAQDGSVRVLRRPRGIRVRVLDATRRPRADPFRAVEASTAGDHSKGSELELTLCHIYMVTTLVRRGLC